MQLSARPSLLVLFVTVVFAASCSDNDDARRSPTQASGLSTSAVTVEATSPMTTAQPVRNPFCPNLPPFTVPVGVTVKLRGSTIVITSISSVFTDSTGRQSPQTMLTQPAVTLPAPGPTPVFCTPTSALVVRTFAFNVGVGCETDHRGTMLVSVQTTDDQGRQRTDQVRVAVN